jgi:RHS repeat-associated protein
VKGSTAYIYSGSKVIAEYASGAAPNAPSKEYVYSGGALLATVAGTNITYHYPDHLSNRMETNATGTVTRAFGHLPFGETWYETGTPDKWKFTGYERDTAESGLDYGVNRLYSVSYGKFQTPDLLNGVTDDPQSLNKYSYVANDPLNWTDPLGLSRQVKLAYPNLNTYDTFSFLGIPFASEAEFLNGEWQSFFLNDVMGLLLGSSFNQTPDPNNNDFTSPCSNIPSTGKTVLAHVNSESDARFQFDGNGSLIGIGIQLTGKMNGTTVQNASIPPNTYVGFTLNSPDTISFGFSNPVKFSEGFGSWKQAYFQTATFSNGQFSNVKGAWSPFGIPVGSSSGNSSILQSAFNGDANAKNLGSGLLNVANLISGSVSCTNLFGGK